MSTTVIVKHENKTTITKGYNFNIFLVLITLRAECIKVAVSQEPLSRLAKHNCWQYQRASQPRNSRESRRSAGISSEKEWQCWGFIFISAAVSSR